jgi:hypothetical protein
MTNTFTRYVFTVPITLSLFAGCAGKSLEVGGSSNDSGVGHSPGAGAGGSSSSSMDASATSDASGQVANGNAHQLTSNAEIALTLGITSDNCVVYFERGSDGNDTLDVLSIDGNSAAVVLDTFSPESTTEVVQISNDVVFFWHGYYTVNNVPLSTLMYWSRAAGIRTSTTFPSVPGYGAASEDGTRIAFLGDAEPFLIVGDAANPDGFQSLSGATAQSTCPIFSFADAHHLFVQPCDTDVAVYDDSTDPWGFNSLGVTTPWRDGAYLSPDGSKAVMLGDHVPTDPNTLRYADLSATGSTVIDSEAEFAQFTFDNAQIIYGNSKNEVKSWSVANNDPPSVLATLDSGTLGSVLPTNDDSFAMVDTQSVDSVGGKTYLLGLNPPSPLLEINAEGYGAGTTLDSKYVVYVKQDGTIAARAISSTLMPELIFPGGTSQMVDGFVAPSTVILEQSILGQDGGATDSFEVNAVDPRTMIPNALAPSCEWFGLTNTQDRFVYQHNGSLYVGKL